MEKFNHFHLWAQIPAHVTMISTRAGATLFNDESNGKAIINNIDLFAVATDAIVGNHLCVHQTLIAQTYIANQMIA